MKALEGVDRRVAAAVRHFWQTRSHQAVKQQSAGREDQGARGAATGGAQMDGFIDLFAELIRYAGMPESCIFRSSKLELPGFYSALARGQTLTS
jgi:hypothetical protein